MAHDADSSGSSIDGRVVSVGSGSFVVTTGHGDTVTADTTGTTAYSELGNPATLPGVLDGEGVRGGLGASRPEQSRGVRRAAGYSS